MMVNGVYLLKEVNSVEENIIEKIMLTVTVISIFILVTVILIQPIKIHLSGELTGELTADTTKSVGNAPEFWGSAGIKKITLTGIKGDIDIEVPYYIFLFYGNKLESLRGE